MLLCVADNATRATWLFEHLTREYELLRNPDDDDRSALGDHPDRLEGVRRRQGQRGGAARDGEHGRLEGKPGEHVRCIVSVNMLSEGWDVKSVSHILGLRAFGSPLLTEQMIGRGLRRTTTTC